ncbi:MAG: cytochrome c oxidase subunit II [Anaerolineaceae bacterium]|jgi:cytochrome c oxidase subunit 2|nr:cytochrome c oxidase subunit II [Anaerolineaceae bacterium]
MKHFSIVAILVVLLTVIVYFFLQTVGLLPIQASSQSIVIDQLFDIHIGIIAFLFSLIVVFIAYSLVVFRRKKEMPQEEGRHFTGSTKLEIFWTLIPLVAVISISYLGAISLAETRKVDPQALPVKVTAGQWYWSFEYPDYGITSDVLYLPVDRQVKLSLTSKDVIHSFWVPEFRVKQDVLPGENLIKELRFTPIETGDFQVICAELCGGAHAYMNSPVKVVSANEFQDWIDGELGNIPQDPVSLGERLAKNNGCFACHSLDGKDGVGPTWMGLYGSEKTLVSGEKIMVDEEYLHQSIVNPNSQIVLGYPANVMAQNYAEVFTDEDLNNMIAFIKSLE